MTLGEQIKKKRKDERLSAEDLAIRLGVKKENVYKWENGSTPSDPEIYSKLISWLNNSESGIIKLPHHGSFQKLNSEVESKYVSLLEKTLSEKEADLKIYRSTVEKITSVDKEISDLKITVHGLQERIEAADSNIEVLREWLIDRFVEMKKGSPQEVAASMGRKTVELSKKAKKADIQRSSGK